MARVKYYDSETGSWKRADESNFIAPVLSVNGQTGNVTAEEAGAVAAHDASGTAHADIRALITQLQSGKLNSAGIQVKKAQLTLEDGTAVLIDVLVASEGTVVSSYTNQVPLSVGTDKVTVYGVDYNGDGTNDGYQNGYRLSSSGAEKTLAASSVSGFIPAKGGDTIRIFGCGWGSDAHGMNYIAAYKEDLTFIGAATSNAGPGYGTAITEAMGNWTVDSEGNTTLKLAAVADIAWIRISSRGLSSTTTVDGANLIVTVNEEITE